MFIQNQKQLKKGRCGTKAEKEAHARHQNPG